MMLDSQQQTKHEFGGKQKNFEDFILLIPLVIFIPKLVVGYSLNLSFYLLLFGCLTLH